MSGRGSTRANSAIAACAVVMAVGLVGCGGTTDDAKSEAAPTSAAPKMATAATPSPASALALVDDEESADSGKPVVVKVLDNDTLTRKGGTPGNLEVALSAGEFTIDLATLPGHGTAKVDGSTIVYTSAKGYGGADEFTYQVDVKGSPALTGTAVVRITVAAPAPTPTPTPTPVKAKKPAPPKVYYANCDAVRAAGADPVREGEPGYAPHLDRDGDGVGCESSGGGSGGTTGGSGGSGGSGGGSGGGSEGTYYANCAAARAAGAAPVHAGDPGYGRHLDRDGDGVGCE
ncbi:excalibur calcium-binding domain-containing protein [Streptomyces sp. NBC_01210]|uniref:excalibur calcium-binding domain-containing protein n=1 Tax=Streptomyces sp. NBC_01210 TaxID=2903774 RepID=UPI002E155B83|nr:excalibur calcium-binding domain-containing protein [Streptomyces sp. NBC_01210]